MNKSVFFSLLLLFIGIDTVKSQSHDFLPDSNVYWHINTINWGYYYPQNPYGVLGDTTIGPNEYLQIHQSLDTIWDQNNTEFFCAAREENDKWLFVQEGDSVEFMLYDFSVNIGDTIEMYNPWSDGLEDDYPSVTAIDSVLISGEYKKRISIDHFEYTGWPEYWIEGIGSTAGLFYTANYIFDTGNQLMCFYQNDSVIFNNAPNGDCDYTTGISELSNNPTLDIFPNPVEDKLFIVTKDSEQSIEQVLIWDIYGKLIESYYFGGTSYQEINLMDMTSGFYIVEVKFDGGSIVSQKIVKL